MGGGGGNQHGAQVDLPERAPIKRNAFTRTGVWGEKQGLESNRPCLARPSTGGSYKKVGTFILGGLKRALTWGRGDRNRGKRGQNKYLRHHRPGNQFQRRFCRSERRGTLAGGRPGGRFPGCQKRKRRMRKKKTHGSKSAGGHRGKLGSA